MPPLAHASAPALTILAAVLLIVAVLRWTCSTNC